MQSQQYYFANPNQTQVIFSKILYKISTAIQWAWDNWDASIVETYYEGDKPKYPTEDFTTQWVNNNDFEADGYVE